MRLGLKVDAILKKYGWGAATDTPWDIKKTVQELRFWHDQGFEVVEVTSDLSSQRGSFFQMTDDDWRSTRSVIEDAGLEIYSLLAWRRMICRPAWAEEKWADLLHIAHISEILGVSIVDVLISPPKPLNPFVGQPARPLFRSRWDATDQDYAVSATKLKEYAQRLAGFSSALAIEIHEDSIHDTAESALRLLSLIDEPNVGLNPDSMDNAWLYPDDEDIPDAVTQANMVAPYVNHWHVKQYLRTMQADGNWQREPVHADEGTQPIHAYAQALVQAGYSGVAIHECGRGADYGYAMRRFLDYMRWLLDEYIPNVPCI
jgi:sugar phosphate isomerase/epimerase